MTPVSERGGAILRRLPGGIVSVAEIGCFVGTLSRFLLANRPSLSLVMVDNWAPAEEQPEEYRVTGDRHAHQTESECRRYRLKAKSRVHRYGPDRVRVLVGRSCDMAANIEDRSLDMVFIDADHSEAAVLKDIAAWLPKVRRGGWIGGHDYDKCDIPGADLSGVKRAVDIWAGGRSMIELDSDHTWFSKVNA